VPFAKVRSADFYGLEHKPDRTRAKLNNQWPYVKILAASDRANRDILLD
jgi:hypothetical protein